MTENHFDLIIIGAGINGAGIARDAASRGLQVLLLEQGDIGSGTTSWSSRLIHGGLRYLEFGELSLVYESLHERRYLRQMASHLVKPIRINIPFYRGGRRGPLLIKAGMLAYDLLSLGKSLPRHRMLSRRGLLGLEPGLNPTGLRGGVQYYDAQVTYAERLVVENVAAAVASGAVLKTYSPVTGIDVVNGKVESVRYRDRITQKEIVAAADIVVNAAGPWVDRVLATTLLELPRLMGGTKGSHIIVGHFDGAPHDAFYVEAHSDGRPFFIIPWNGQYLIGTTDIRYQKDPADAHASRAEISYLLNETNRVFPEAELKPRDIHYTYSGVRPLPYRADGPESAITRRHIIRHEAKIARGLISIIGGKLTTYRNLSQQAVDLVIKLRGTGNLPCTTSETPLPGARKIDKARRLLRKQTNLSRTGVDRILSIYGGRAAYIVKLLEEDATLGQSLDTANSVLAAEVPFVIRHEFAINLIDIMHRRLMVGLAEDMGDEVANAVASLAGKELGWSASELAQEIDGLKNYNARLKPSV